MTEVCPFYNKLLQEQGVRTVKYRGANLKHRLQKYFGELLQFFRNQRKITEPEMLTAADVPWDLSLASAAQHLTSCDTKHDSEDSEDLLLNEGDDLQDLARPTATAFNDAIRLEMFHTALFLRGLISDMGDT